uniref:Uncharacterized protein n=1 Tax=Craspedostauros australis TaxID=1486917 RepID=A0A7R9WNY8_9STRA|mmetsp:Transcript_13326/g.36829  ORF Transcript_13326/g.36829 Transcript_13326/m.36829 type:complete len:130 (+) Transcript_13326:116-505(+)
MFVGDHFDIMTMHSFILLVQTHPSIGQSIMFFAAYTSTTRMHGKNREDHQYSCPCYNLKWNCWHTLQSRPMIPMVAIVRETRFGLDCTHPPLCEIDDTIRCCSALFESALLISICDGISRAPQCCKDRR